MTGLDVTMKVYVQQGELITNTKLLAELTNIIVVCIMNKEIGCFYLLIGFKAGKRP